MTEEEAHEIRMKRKALSAEIKRLGEILKAAGETVYPGNPIRKPDGPTAIGINAYNAQWRERNREHNRKYMREYMRKFRMKQAAASSMGM